MRRKRLGAHPGQAAQRDGGVLNQAARQGLDQALAKRGLGSSVYNGADGYRDVIRAVGRANDPAFDENNFDVAE